MARVNRRTLTRLLLQGTLASAASPVFGQVAAARPQPRFSVMLWTLSKLATFDQSLEIVARAGYNGIELVGEFQKWSPAETSRILSRLRSLNLTVDAMSGVKAGFAVPAQTADFLTQFRSHLDAARTLHCPQVILLSGPSVPGISPDQQRKTAVENLSRAADLASKVNMEIVIEPIDPLEQPSIFLQSVAQAFPIVRDVNAPNLKVLYDLYHEQRAFGNLIEKLENNIDSIGLIHIADVPGRHEPGSGEVDFANVYRVLAKHRYNRWIAMEFYPTHDPVSTLTSARQEVVTAFNAAT